MVDQLRELEDAILAADDHGTAVRVLSEVARLAREIRAERKATRPASGEGVVVDLAEERARRAKGAA